MAKTGSPKWDEMPARIGFADIDSLRAAYMMARNRVSKDAQKMQEIKQKLDSIHKKWKKDGIKDEGIQDDQD